MPEKKQNTHIAVIGGGIMGLCAALTFARAGYAVTLYDGNGFPAEDSASFMAGGMLAPYAEIEHMPPALLPACFDGIKFWQQEKSARTGKTIATRNGSLLLCHEADRYILERFRAHLPANAYETLSPARITTIEPALGLGAQQPFSGIFLHDEAFLNPQDAMQTIADTLRQMRNVTLVTENITPQTLRAQQSDKQAAPVGVLDCRGMAATGDIPALRAVKGEIAIVRNPELSLSRPVRLMHPRYPLYIVPREDHVFMIGATNVETLGTGVSVRSALELLTAAYSLHPSFAEAEILSVQAGLRPSYPDNVPHIAHDRQNNIMSCNGLYRHGFLLAPVLAQCALDIVENRENRYTLLYKPEQPEE